MDMHLRVIFGLLVSLISLASSMADLKQDFRDIAAVIPRRRVSFIAARYYVLDRQFRKSFEYVRSSAFQNNWQRMRETAEMKKIREYVRKNAAEHELSQLIDIVPSRLKAFQLPQKVPMSMLLERTIASFLRDVVRSLPRTRISKLIATKVNENGDFARLYKALKEPSFKQLVYEARHSSNLTKSIQEFQKNFIDVDEIISIGFGLLEWGP